MSKKSRSLFYRLCINLLMTLCSECEGCCDTALLCNYRSSSLWVKDENFRIQKLLEPIPPKLLELLPHLSRSLLG